MWSRGDPGSIHLVVLLSPRAMESFSQIFYSWMQIREERVEGLHVLHFHHFLPHPLGHIVLSPSLDASGGGKHNLARSPDRKECENQRTSSQSALWPPSPGPCLVFSGELHGWAAGNSTHLNPQPVFLPLLLGGTTPNPLTQTRNLDTIIAFFLPLSHLVHMKSIKPTSSMCLGGICPFSCIPALPEFGVFILHLDHLDLCPPPLWASTDNILPPSPSPTVWTSDQTIFI